jgi:hypothetical protein
MPAKVPVTWKAEASGALSGVAIHDGSLIDFHSSATGQSYLIRNGLSQIVEIELTGVSEFNVLRFWQGAISSEVFVWKLAVVPPHLWAVADGAWNTLFEGRASLEDAKIAAARLVQTKPEAFLFQLLCSYGGAFAAICDNVAVYRHP